MEAEDDTGAYDELVRYLADKFRDVTKDTDTVEWWQVRCRVLQASVLLILSQKHADIYPTLARMAIDILPIPASSVSCERLFSRAKLTSTDRRSRLGPDLFEALECLKYNWKDKVVDYARANAQEVEEVFEDILDYQVLQEQDELYGEDMGDLSEEEDAEDVPGERAFETL